MQAVANVETTEEWLSKEVAAGRLGLSTRRVLEYAKAGKMRSRFEPRLQGGGHGGRLPVVLLAADVEALRRERHRGEAEAQERALVALDPQARRELQAARTPIAAAAVEKPRPWITLDEAAEYSGLPASALLALVRRGKLPALDVGRREGGKYRVKRTDVDAIEGDRTLT